MTEPANQPDDHLRYLLATGPRNSRLALALLAEKGFTPKQVRGARERLGLVVARSGNGANMSSMWRLPGDDGAPGAGDAPDIHQRAPGLTLGELRRHHARVVAFAARGLDAQVAGRVADALVGRDRGGLRATGSCAECACVPLRICPTAPRPAIEIHECWSRRQCTP